MRFFYLFYLSIFSLVIFSCNNEKRKNNILQNNKTEKKNTTNHKIKYAKGFNIINKKNYKILQVYNPWQGADKIQYEYVLINKDDNFIKPSNSSIIIKTPIKKIICLSTTHIAFIDLLNETNSIIGLSGSRFVNNNKIEKLIEQGKISEIGYDNNINYELIISLQPDIVMAYGITGESIGFFNKLKDLDINVVFNAEYLEKEPLGKTEWLKFIACFYNKENIAEKEFNRIEIKFNNLCRLTDSVYSKPVILTGLPWKDNWYVPGGNSYAAKLINLAGGKYLWKDNISHESIALNIEKVFEKSQVADIWINIGAANSISDIIAVDERISEFQILKNNKLYNNNAIISKNGGNDYWESGLINPHLILKDMIYIFHPDIIPNHKLIYYKKIE
ncbi:MAG: ABC transporter substrate-binding protein [Bacteroidales bacterium]|nr:ABC transporter substrate-binding protein [Bacteroidales bacterium]